MPDLEGAPDRGPARWKGCLIPWVAAWPSDFPNFVRAGGPEFRNLPIACDALGPRRGSRPLLGVMSCERQRAAVLERRCQVCAKPLGTYGWAPAFGRTPKDCLPVDRPFLEATGDHILRSEPPACLPCAALSVRICPGILRARPSWQAVTDRAVQVQLLNASTRILDIILPEPRPKAIVGYVEYVVTGSVGSLSHEAFLATTEGLADPAALARWEKLGRELYARARSSASTAARAASPGSDRR